VTTMQERNALLGKTLVIAWLWLPFAVGCLLRFWGVGYQVAGGDELHAVRAALAAPVMTVLTTYQGSDPCLPLSGFYRLLMDLGVAVSELHLRLPILAGGVLVLWLVPWWTAHQIGRHSAYVVAWLVALSPVLIHYSRFIRPYLPIVGLGFAAAVAYERWLRTASSRSALLYAILTVLAGYFHLVSVPFVLSPFLYYAGAKLLRPGAVAPSWRAAILLGLATLGGFLVFLLPTWSSLMSLIAIKKQPLQVGWHTWQALMGLQSGTSSRWLMTLFWLLALAGFVDLLRRKPKLACYSATLVAGQIAGLFLLSPLAMQQGPIFNRYMLVTLPFVLIWAAAGLTASWEWITSSPWNLLPRLATAAIGVLLAVSGPVFDREFRQSPFVLRPESLLFYLQRQAPDIELPEAYRHFDHQRDGRIVEFPWHTTWRYCHAIVRYQEIHGRRVIVSPGERLLWDERLSGFYNMVAPQTDRILATDAAYLVLHLSSAAENAALDWRKAPPGSPLAADRERRQRELARFDQEAARQLVILEQLWGEADFAADDFRVWDLTRLREQDRRNEIREASTR